jgi:hypothetical protein
VKLYFWTACQLEVFHDETREMVLTLWLLDLEELGNVDWLGISSSDHDRKVWARNTTVVSLGTIDRRLDLDTDIERF